MPTLQNGDAKAKFEQSTYRKSLTSAGCNYIISPNILKSAIPNQIIAAVRQLFLTITSKKLYRPKSRSI